MNYYTIPLSNAAQQAGVTLAGVLYNLTVLYRDNPQAGWTLDIADANQNPILQGVPFVTDYLGFGGMLAVVNAAAPLVPPTFRNLGSDVLIYWLTP